MNGDPILIDPPQEQLAAGIEENLFSLFRSMATALGGDIEESDMAVRAYERIGFRVTGARIDCYLWRRGA